jgi:hypothetical protein
MGDGGIGDISNNRAIMYQGEYAAPRTIPSAARPLSSLFGKIGLAGI